MRANEGANYLGRTRSMACNMHLEIRPGFGDTVAITELLGLFSPPAMCPMQFKLHVYHAVIRANVIYGLEGAHMDGARYSKLNALHLKGLRKMLGMKTPCTHKELQLGCVRKGKQKGGNGIRDGHRANGRLFGGKGEGTT